MKTSSTIGEIVKNRKLIVNLAKNDLKAKFAGSYMGIIWAFVQPIITLLVYWFVFEKALGAGTQITKGGIEAPYILWLTAGMVPWFYFSEAFSAGTTSLIEYNYLVKKVVFNVSTLPVVKCVSSLFTHIGLIIFMFVLYFCYGYTPKLYMIQVIYYSFCAFVLAVAASYFTSAITVFFRDMQQIVNVFLQVLIWATPIMWNLDNMVATGHVPRTIEIILKLNPMYYIVSGYRASMIDGTYFWSASHLTIYFWAVTIILFIIGTRVFHRLKPHFADIL